jgi:uncharacterized protein
LSADPSGGKTPERIVLRPLGTPLPLGFVGLAVATSVVACLNLDWIPVSEQGQVGLVLVSFAFPLQALAAALCFLGRDAPSGAGIGGQAGAWLTLGLLLLSSPAGARSQVAAVFLWAVAAGLVPSAISAGLGKIGLAIVMGGTALRFVLTGLYERLGGVGWEHAAGWEGIALAGLALYTALAVDLESATHRPLLPLGRRGAGRMTLDPDHGQDPRNEVRSEPGVRDQL